MFLKAFITYLRAERNCSSHTLKAYETDVRMFCDYMKSVDSTLTLADCDCDLIRCWVANLVDEGCAVNSVCRKLSSVRAFFVFLKNKGVVASNPAKDVKAPKKHKMLPMFLKEEEMSQLLDEQLSGDDYINIRNRAVISCFYEMGLRLSELRGLNLADIDWSESKIKVLGKRDKERIVPFGPSLRSLLLEYLEAREVVVGGDSALFLSEKGVRLSASQIYRMVRSALSLVSTVKRRGPHTLRHTFATVMLNNEAELGVVKELLGHEQLATTEIYTHVSFEELKRVYKKAHPRA